MTLRPWILRLCPVLCALLFSSCLDLHEEFWLLEDGSAKVEVTCEIPRGATLLMGGSRGVKKMAESMLEDQSQIDTYQVEVSEADQRVELKVHCTAEEILAFDRLRKSIQQQENLHPAIRKMVGEFNISLEGLDGVAVTRTVAPGEAVPALKWLPKSKLEGYRMVKVMHFPHPITQHNATEQSDEGRTLKWDNSLASAIQTPVIYEFVMPYPIPWGWVIIGVLALLVLAMSGFVLIRSHLRAKPKP